MLEIPKKHSLTILHKPRTLVNITCGDNNEENSQSLFFRLGQGGLDVVSIFKEREAILEEKSPILVTSIHTSSSEYSLMEGYEER